MRRIKNLFLCLRFPFLKLPKNNYKDTWYDFIPCGWQKAFGKKLCKDLKAALKVDNCVKTFKFRDIKEKYGELRMCAEGFGDETSRVLTYYEVISKGYCIDCGEPARFVTKGWIEFYCEGCFITEWLRHHNELEELDNYFKSEKECRLTKEDIPTVITTDIKTQKMLDSIDWYTLWDLGKEEDED